MVCLQIAHIIFIIPFFLTHRFFLFLLWLWLLVVILVAEDAFGIRWKSPTPRGAPENTRSWPNQGINAGLCTPRKTKYVLGHSKNPSRMKRKYSSLFVFALRTLRFSFVLAAFFLYVIDKAVEHRSRLTTYVAVTVLLGIWSNCQLAI